MASPCPDRGATFTTDETCDDRFCVGQARELEEPKRYAVHHLSVPSFMLQHNRYTRDGWLHTAYLLERFLASMTPADAHRQGGSTLDSGKRTFSFTRRPKLADVRSVVWTRTVANVRLDTAEHYRADVQAWAESVVRDSAALRARHEKANDS